MTVHKLRKAATTTSQLAFLFISLRWIQAQTAVVLPQIYLAPVLFARKQHVHIHQIANGQAFQTRSRLPRPERLPEAGQAAKMELVNGHDI